MCGWLRDEIALASRSKRARNSVSVASVGARTLTATLRSSRVSRALIHLAHAPGPDKREDLAGAKQCARL